MSIINMLLFLNSVKSDLNFEPSLVGMDQVLREIRLFEHEFQKRDTAFWVTLQICQLKSKWEGKTIYFLARN